MGNGSKSDGRITRAALKPVPLVLLAAGGAAGALIAWPFAAAGAAACCIAVAIGAIRAEPAVTLAATPRLRPPSGIRSTEVVALVVRIRKAHEAVTLAATELDPSTRELFAEGAVRIDHLVEEAYGLAGRADRLRAQLDAAAAGMTPTAGRQPREDEYGRVRDELGRVAETLESWIGKLAHVGADERRSGDTAKEVTEELERVHRVVRELESTERR